MNNFTADKHATLTNLTRSRLGSIAWNPVREPGITCTVCTAPIDPQYQKCARCLQHAQSGVKVSPHVLPLTYAIKGNGQLYQDMCRYKEPSVGQEEDAPERVKFLLGYFAWTHLACVSALCGIPVSRVSTVPSLRGHQEPHPLATLVQQVLHRLELPIMKLEATRIVPKPQRSQFGPDNFDAPRSLISEHVLLFEDTWVSGNNAQSAAATLYQAGAAAVTIVAAARLLDPDCWVPTRRFLENYPEAQRQWTTACPAVGPTLLNKCRSSFVS